MNPHWYLGIGLYHAPAPVEPYDPILARAQKQAFDEISEGLNFIEHIQMTDQSMIRRAVATAWKVFKEAAREGVYDVAEDSGSAAA